jgi:hypothetical protein
MPFLTYTGKTFMRSLLWRDSTDKERDQLRVAIRTRRDQAAKEGAHARHGH